MIVYGKPETEETLWPCAQDTCEISTFDAANPRIAVPLPRLSAAIEQRLAVCQIQRALSRRGEEVMASLDELRPETHR